jgi:hypothetical protein
MECGLAHEHDRAYQSQGERSTARGPGWPPPGLGKEKNGGNWRFFEGEKRHFPVLGAEASKHKPLMWPLLCRPTFLAPERKKNVGRHFRTKTFVDVTPRHQATGKLLALQCTSLRSTSFRSGFEILLAVDGCIQSCVAGHHTRHILGILGTLFGVPSMPSMCRV